MRGIFGNSNEGVWGYLPIRRKGNSSLDQKRNKTPFLCPVVEKRKIRNLSRAPSGRALSLSKVALLVGDLLECFFGFGFLLVEETVEDRWENALGV